MANVIIKNFKSDAHAKCFIEWFEGQGEQDQSYWFAETELSCQYTDVLKTYKGGEPQQDTNDDWVLCLSDIKEVTNEERS